MGTGLTHLRIVLKHEQHYKEGRGYYLSFTPVEKRKLSFAMIASYPGGYLPLEPAERRSKGARKRAKEKLNPELLEKLIQLTGETRLGS